MIQEKGYIVEKILENHALLEENILSNKQYLKSNFIKINK